MPLITEPGIYPDISSADYFADPCPAPSLTQSIAKVLLDQSPLHAKIAHPRLCPPEQADDEEKYTAAQAIGNATHAILIGRGKELAAAPWDDWRSKEARAFRSEQTKLGKTPILQKHMDEAHKVTLAARLQLIDAGLPDAFHKGDGEVCIVAQEDDIWLRSLVDWMESPTMIYDLKSTGTSFAPHTIAMKIEADGWHIQAAMQERILDLIDPDNAGRRKFRFIAIENYPPFALLPIELDEHWMTLGRKKLQFAIDRWTNCITTNRWPCYPLALHRPEYPQFREAAWLKREVEEDEHRRARLPANLLAAG